MSINTQQVAFSFFFVCCKFKNSLSIQGDSKWHLRQPAASFRF